MFRKTSRRFAVSPVASRTTFPFRLKLCAAVVFACLIWIVLFRSVVNHNPMSNDEQTRRAEALAVLTARLLDEKCFFVTPSTVMDAKQRVFLDLRALPREVALSVLEVHAPLSLPELLDAAFSAVTPPPGRVVFSVASQQMTSQNSASVSKILGGIDLGANALDSLTERVAIFSQLEVLFLTGNRLKSVPPVVKTLGKLNRLSLKSNELTSIAPKRDFPLLIMHLILTENQINTIDGSFADHGALRKLMLSGNRVRGWGQLFASESTGSISPKVPPVFSSLELLRVSRNAVTTIGGERDEAGDDSDSAVLHRFEKLSWISFAGNPGVLPEAVRQQQGRWTKSDLDFVLKGVPDVSHMTLVRDGDAVPGDLLPIAVIGQGASGIVKRCYLRDGAAYHAVAVKFFKRVSSDGSGADEIVAATQAPKHPSVLAPIGHIRFTSVDSLVKEGVLASTTASDLYVFDFRDNRPSPSYDDEQSIVALVFPLVHAKNLGEPPTIWTVSDDIFPKRSVGGLLSEWGSVPQSATLRDRAAFVSIAFLGAARMIVDVTSAIAALHSKETRLVHGDLYMHNLFFGALAPSASFSSDAPSPLQGNVHSASSPVLGVLQRLCATSNESYSIPIPAVATHEMELVITTACRNGGIPSPAYWLVNRTFVSDFGASFSYKQEHNANVRVGLRKAEFRSLATVVRDVLESVIPLAFLVETLHAAPEFGDGAHADSQQQLAAVLLKASEGTPAMSTFDRLFALENALHHLLRLTTMQDDLFLIGELGPALGITTKLLHCCISSISMLLTQLIGSTDEYFFQYAVEQLELCMRNNLFADRDPS